MRCYGSMHGFDPLRTEFNSQHPHQNKTKICGKCKETKDINAFSIKRKARGDRQSYCIPCNRTKSKEHYDKDKTTYTARTKRNKAKIRRFILEYLKVHPCVDCGEADPVVLDFDHVRGEKDFNLSAAYLWGYSIKKLEVEIAKCEIRCANCHRRRTAKTGNYWKYTGNF